ncbi:MAG: hypothetical protein FWB91_06745 [Defluviitaleaceae bacterium]|nr:hypothetical protein [Defluviitaleaceae bacterium]
MLLNIFMILLVICAGLSFINAIFACMGKDSGVYLSKKARERHREQYKEDEVLRFYSWFGFVEFVAFTFVFVGLLFGLNPIWGPLALLIPAGGQRYSRSSRFRIL